MSLRGYKPKWGKALWTQICPVKLKVLEVKGGVVTKVKLLPEVKKIKWSQARETRRRKRRSDSAWTKLSRRLVREAEARGDRCPVVNAIFGLKASFKYGHPVSDRIDQVHHVFGRGHGGRGPLLLDERLLIPVSRQGHRWIDAHKYEAMAYGWLAHKGWYNTPVPERATMEKNKWGGLEIVLDGVVICG